MIRDRIVVDASITLKWFHPEKGSEPALKILQRITRGDVIAFIPDLLLYEVANVWIRGMKEKSEDMPSILDALQNLAWSIISPSTTLLSEAAQLATEYKKISVYDATYIALAVQEHAYLLTADEKLCTRVGKPLTKSLFE